MADVYKVDTAFERIEVEFAVVVKLFMHYCFADGGEEGNLNG